ncbi:MAG: Stage IV sporulation protein FB [Firmicutes bacterium]|nr:Stage IV sporulation protein FB [candidate division NPL-UPA2 bacterium]
MYLGQVLGVSLKVHYLFLLWLFVSATLGDWVYTAILVFSVCFHELGHILAALNCRVGVEEVVLMPFGSVAKLGRWLGVEPKTEAAIALAGPANSLVLCVVGLLWQSAAWGDALLEVNLLLLTVNLLPILPLDGGRIVRSAIVRRRGLAAGATWGLLCVAALLFVYGVSSVNAVVLAVFLLYAVAEEKKMMPYLFGSYLGSKQGELSASGTLAGRVIVVLPDTPVARALKDMTPGCYHLFHVVHPNGQVIAVTEESLFAALVNQGLGITFADVSTPL